MASSDTQIDETASQKQNARVKPARCNDPLTGFLGVIAGLDPAIHRSSSGMDARVKPAHDAPLP